MVLGLKEGIPVDESDLTDMTIRGADNGVGVAFNRPCTAAQGARKEFVEMTVIFRPLVKRFAPVDLVLFCKPADEGVLEPARLYAGKPIRQSGNGVLRKRVE